MLILAIILLGMLAGAAAQLIFRGGQKRPIDWTAAIVVGLIGSFVGGLIFSLIAGDGIELRPSGIIGSIVGAVVVTGIYKLFTGRVPGSKARR